MKFTELNIRAIILTALTVLLSSFQQNPNTYDIQSKIKAVYIYNFTKYFEWPNSKKTGNFIICISGSDAKLENELKNLTKNKKVGNQDIEIQSSFAVNEKANILFLLENNPKKIAEAAKKLKGKGVLLLSEADNSCKNGSCLNFIMQDNKLKVEYSKQSAIRMGLKTNDEFDKLTIKID
ncbi:MAG: YfiR family protein [Bacteroidia bacterium]|nr:YfiR family protein [Bacteroidia bacterium]